MYYKAYSYSISIFNLIFNLIFKFHYIKNPKFVVNRLYGATNMKEETYYGTSSYTEGLYFA